MQGLFGCRIAVSTTAGTVAKYVGDEVQPEAQFQNGKRDVPF